MALAVPVSLALAALLVRLQEEAEVDVDWWSRELIEVDGKSITLLKIGVGLVLFLFGLFLSRVLSRFLGASLFSRLRMTEGAAAAVESLLFYLFVVVFGLSGLSFAGVPLTAFTLLGGAAAIGIGFGSQTLIANFISGLILLIERPINVGNLVQLDDLYGTIERIGLRSTRVRTGENVEIIVPNSKFLEENVVNHTLSDARVRIHVSVGVAYGSDTALVRRLLEQALDEHARVLREPAPTILFAEFGNDALVFEGHFWVESRRMLERRVVQSEVRFRLDELFRENGVTVAFPQRDVHLDAAGPLDVRLVGDDGK